MNSEIIKTAIIANLDALAARLEHMTEAAKEAAEGMPKHGQNWAIGTILEFEQMMPEIQALYTTIKTLHRV